MKSKTIMVIVTIIIQVFILGLSFTSSIAQDPVLTINGITERDSISSSGEQGNDGSYTPDVSADGRYVAFQSRASNLVNEDTNGFTDIFVHDRQTRMTERVSVSSSGEQGNGEGWTLSISADGRYVAFDSLASNLVAGDTNGYDDVFIHDRQTGVTERVSAGSGGQQGNDSSIEPSISSDGRYVAFSSWASNLVDGDTNGFNDVFVHDRQTGVTERVSVSSSGEQGNNTSRCPFISIDGRFVTFVSDASNLVDGDTNGIRDIFVHDRQTGVTERVSVSSTGEQGNDWSFDPSISADGRYVAFASLSSNLVVEDTNAIADIFVRDRQAGVTERVSVSSFGEEGNGTSCVYGYYCLDISTDGRFVTFDSNASNLVAGDTNGTEDVFIHDLQTGVTERVSVNSNGDQGNDRSEIPSITADGRYVSFDSYASNLVNGDTNGYADIFLHDREGGGNGYSISGKVVDQTGNPLAEVLISSDIGETAVTDNTGFYMITNLPTGKYSIFPSKSGYTFKPISLTILLKHTKSGQNFIGQIAMCGLSINKSESKVSGNACVPPAATPFLYLPIYTYSLPEMVLRDSDYTGGRITSWFDHNKPTYLRDKNNYIELYDGITHAGSPTQTLKSGLSCYERICYDGHNGLDLSQWDLQRGQHISEKAILPAASGIVLETCHMDQQNYPNEPCNRVGLGRYIVISHLNNTYATLYAHLASIADWVAPGVTVTRNDYSTPAPIGVMGETGNADGVHLHFQVFFNSNYDSPWIPLNAQVVDTFGWLPAGIRQDDWSMPSVPLWKNFSPNSCIIDTESVSLLTGGVKVQIPLGAVPNGNVVSLSPTSFENTVSTVLRGLGVSFNISSFGFPKQNNKLVQESNEFAQPITVTVNYSGTLNDHIDNSQVALYRFDSTNGNWIPEATSLDPINFTATSLITNEGFFNLEAPLVCPNDVREPNNDVPNVNNIILSYPSDTIISEFFDIQNDVDWFSIEVIAGITFTIQTQNLANGVDTILTVYKSDGQSIIASDDNSGGGLASKVNFLANEDSTYFVSVSQAVGSAFGCNSSYEVKILNTMRHLFLPVLSRSN